MKASISDLKGVAWVEVEKGTYPRLVSSYSVHD